MPYRGELMPEAEVRVYARNAQAPNAESHPADKATLIAYRNSPHSVREIIDPSYQQNILWQRNAREFDAGGTATLWPTQPWGVGAVMVNAAPSELLVPVEEMPKDEQTGLIKVHFVYEDSQAAQVAYARHILAGIHAVNENQLPGEKVLQGRPSVVAVENAVRVLGTGRTLATPHAQIIKTGIIEHNNSELRFAGDLRVEQWIKKHFPDAVSYVAQLDERMRRELSTQRYRESVDFITLYPRQERKPYGYTASTSITDDMSIESQATRYASMMAAHYVAGAEQLTTYLDSLNGQMRPSLRRRIRPQYSFRQYTYFLPDEEHGGNRLHVTWSPELLGGAALEDAGGYLRRGPDIDDSVDPNKLRQYRLNVEHSIVTQLEPFGDIFTPANPARLAS